MRTLKLLNKKYLVIILIFCFCGFSVNSEEPVDIWNLEEKKPLEKDLKDNTLEKNISTQNSIYEMQSQKNGQINIEEDQTLLSAKIEIVGLYDPAENGLDINMWSNSEGNQILNLFKDIDKINLSNDASEILKFYF